MSEIGTDEASRAAARTSSNGHEPPTQRRWRSLEADLELFDAEPGPARPARVAITSYEFNGIVRNGGIGTACTSLARALVAEGHEVDLFFTGWADDPSPEAFERWTGRYAAEGMRLHWFDQASLVRQYDAPVYGAAHSLALYRQLAEHDAERPYDVIHFVESVGHGFYSLCAKRQGLAFQSATTVVGVHSPRRWMAEAHGELFDSPEYIADEFLELRSLELADIVVSPSVHMLDWLTARGVRLPERSYVQQYVTDFEQTPNGAERVTDDASQIDELVFFGRLEPRKGLVAFCEVLELLAKRSHRGLRKVTFLGRHASVDGMHSGKYIAERSERWPWEHEVLADLDRDDALEYLQQPGRVAVMASPMDNSPNTVYEAIGLRIPFVASSGGGIAELVHPDDRDEFTFDPCDLDQEKDPRRTRHRYTGDSLLAHLERILAGPVRAARFAIDPVVNRDAHLAWHRAVAATGGSGVHEVSPARQNGSPQVTTVDVADLGELEPRSPDDFVLLLDTGVECEPRLAAALLAAALSSSSSALVTSLGIKDLEADDGSTRESWFLPTGGPAPFGIVANCFGAGAVLASCATLERIGVLGGGQPSFAGGVAGVLARAAVGGEQIDIVPEALYRVPATATSSGGLLSASQTAHESFAAYHCFFIDPGVRDLASIASRAHADASAMRTRAEAAERAASEAQARLAVIQASRSWRLTGVLRRAGALARRGTRRSLV